jgi:transposase
MQLHRNAKLGLHGRLELVLAIERGLSLKAAAAAFSVSPATAHRWWKHWRDAVEEERGSLACLCDRSSRPKRCARMLPASEQARICAARRRSGWGPRLLAGETGHAHATVWRTLRRAGLSRLPRAPRDQARRYEWPCPAISCTSTASASAASPAPATP